MSIVDAIKQPIYFQLSTAESNLNFLEEHGPGIIRIALNIYLKTVPMPFAPENPLIGEAIKTLHKIIKSSREQIVELRGLVDGLGSPNALRAAAEQWENVVRLGAISLNEKIEDSALGTRSRSNWSGDLSEDYRDAITVMTAELGDLANAAESTAEALSATAFLMDSFAATLLATALELAVTLAALIAAILAAIPTAGISLAAAIITAASALGLVALTVLGMGTWIYFQSQDISAILSKDAVGASIQKWSNAPLGG